MAESKIHLEGFEHHIWPALVALFIGASVFWVATDRDPPMTLSNGRITPSVVSNGDYEIGWTQEWVRSCPYSVSFQIIDSQRHISSYEGIEMPAPPSGVRQVQITRKLPPLHDGTARYRPLVEFYCDWVQRIWPVRMRPPDILFTVEKAPAK